MKNVLIFIISIISISNVISAKDNDFLELYDSFRFSLYSYVQDDNFRITPQMTNSIKGFLEKYDNEIIKYRENQLEKYIRPDIEPIEKFERVDKEFISTVREAVTILNPKKMIEDMEAEIDIDYKTIGAFNFTELLSVDPIILINTVFSQASIMILNQYLDMPSEELSRYYTRMALGGIYISATRGNHHFWNIKINSHKMVFSFTFNTENGFCSLDDIWVRQ